MGFAKNSEISDVANPRPTRGPIIPGAPFSDTSLLYQRPRFGLKNENWPTPKNKHDSATVHAAVEYHESPEYRTGFFRSTRLVRHESGALACSHCHITPYQCVICYGLKCHCKPGGVYRHWENGEPIPSRVEADLLENTDARHC